MAGGWETIVSASAAVVSGLFLATAGVLQQRAASRRSSRDRMSLRLVHSLVTDRTWLAGILSAGLSYGFQAVALAFGPLVLVQPLVVSELLFAVPVSVRMRGLRLRRRDWTAVGAVVAGLAIGIVAADPKKGQPIEPFTVWLPALIGVAALTVLCLVTTRFLEGPPMASAFALAGACTMGLQSALYAATIALLKQQGWALFANWEPYALVVASLVGAFLIQNAFQSGPLAASTPVIDATLPLVAIALGVGLFGEHVRTSVLGLTGAIVGIALVIVGIVGLDTSPVVRKEQRLQQQEQQEQEQQEDREHEREQA
jgi:drug/metabolite transporter (DMT)-like permease